MATKQLRVPILPVTEMEQGAFCRSEDDLLAKPLVEEMKANVNWQKIPDHYLNLSPTELDEKIRSSRETLGKRVVLLGHHYQREEVIKYADLQGDSFKLSQYASQQETAEYIVFLGVHFMAETADILSHQQQKVILPNMSAGCSMADMATTEDVLDCWSDLCTVLGPEVVTPITYMNSTADIKALCGRNNGAVCTSSNAKAVMQWAFNQKPKILFLPDEHLGRNTALELGITPEEIVVWNPYKPYGGLTKNELALSKVILWRGHCAVHTRFRPQQIIAARSKYSNVKVIVHPECPQEVIAAADFNGSTEKIISAVNDSEPGSIWGVGTEINLVHRLQVNNPDKIIFCLDPVVCPCSTMYRIHPAYVAWVLDQLVTNAPCNIISVPDDIKVQARDALERMLQITNSSAVD